MLFSSAIEELPDDFGMPILRVLDCSSCKQLRHLPNTGLTSLTMLRTFYLSK